MYESSFEKLEKVLDSELRSVTPHSRSVGRAWFHRCPSCGARLLVAKACTLPHGKGKTIQFVLCPSEHCSEHVIRDDHEPIRLFTAYGPSF